jgi:hypothetical protein
MRLLKQKRPMSRTMVGLLFRRSIPGLRAGFFCCACTQTRVLALLRALRGPLLLAFATIAAPADEAPESSIACLALRNLASSRECALVSSTASLPRPSLRLTLSRISADGRPRRLSRGYRVPAQHCWEEKGIRAKQARAHLSHLPRPRGRSPPQQQLTECLSPPAAANRMSRPKQNVAASEVGAQACFLKRCGN